MDALTIGKVARLAGVGVETIRFYEREGLIEQPPRRTSRYRQYPEETVSRIRFIKRAKELGFSLKEIRELLELRLDPETKCEDILRRANAKIDDIKQKIAALQKMKTALEDLTAACQEKKRTGQCPILEALEDKRIQQL